MTCAPRVATALVGGVVLTVAACADDGNDHAFRAQRAADLAAEFRASRTTTTVAAAPADAAPEEAAAPEQPGPTTPRVEPTGVVIPVIALDNSFRPQLVEVSVGDEVLWENRGMNEHDVLYVEGDEWGVEVEDFQPGDIYAYVFTKPGEYRYFCSIHGTEDVGMIGTVVVNA
jgi:plastocyanin